MESIIDYVKTKQGFQASDRILESGLNILLTKGYVPANQLLGSLKKQWEESLDYRERKLLESIIEYLE